jgi:hypothetical protein
MTGWLEIFFCNEPDEFPNNTRKAKGDSQRIVIFVSNIA